MRTFLFCFVISLFVRPVDAAFVYGTDATDELHGSRSSDDPGVIGFGEWEEGFSLTWDVVETESGWVYSYAIGDDDKDISHLNLEVTFDSPEPLIGYNGEFLDPKWLLANHPGSPGQPIDIFGVKFDEGQDFISFFSDRAPVYGHFYAKSGTDTYAYNAGALDVDSWDVLDFVVRPNGVVPEPGSLALLGLGACVVAVWRRRR